jgi:hypothetical protein
VLTFLKESTPWHMYDLRRGRTSAVVENLNWATDGRWIAVATQKRTVHIFATNPYGGQPDGQSHVNGRVCNSSNLVSSPSPHKNKAQFIYFPSRYLRLFPHSSVCALSSLQLVDHPPRSPSFSYNLTPIRFQNAYSRLLELVLRHHLPPVLFSRHHHGNPFPRRTGVEELTSRTF